MSKTTKQNPAASRGPAGQGREIVILAAMALVAVAIGFALRNQADFGPAVSAFATLVVFAIMILFHLSARGVGALQSLAHRVLRLEARVDRMSAGEAPGAGKAAVRRQDHRAPADRIAQTGATDAAGPVAKPGAAGPLAANPPAGPDQVRPRPVASAGEKSPAVQPRVVDGLVRQLAEELGTRPATSAAEPHDAVGSDPAAIDTRIADIVEIAARGGHTDLYLQPILSLPERKVSYFEVLAYLRTGSGTLLRPAEFREAAEQRSVVPLIDHAMLTQTVMMLRKLANSGQTHPLFCSLSTASMAVPNFLSDFLGFMKSYKDVIDHLVLEIDEGSLDGADGKNLEELASLRRLGFHLSLARVANPREALAKVEGMGFHFIKVEAPILARLQGGALAASSIVEKANADGLQFIVDSIDDDRALALAMKSTAGFGQGLLFSEPKPVIVADEPRRAEAADAKTQAA